MDIIENLEVQAKESHRNLEKAIDKLTVLEKDVEDKNAEMEDIKIGRAHV